MTKSQPSRRSPAHCKPHYQPPGTHLALALPPGRGLPGRRGLGRSGLGIRRRLLAGSLLACGRLLGGRGLGRRRRLVGRRLLAAGGCALGCRPRLGAAGRLLGGTASAQGCTGWGWHLRLGKAQETAGRGPLFALQGTWPPGMHGAVEPPEQAGTSHVISLGQPSTSRAAPPAAAVHSVGPHPHHPPTLEHTRTHPRHPAHLRGFFTEGTLGVLALVAAGAGSASIATGACDAGRGEGRGEGGVQCQFQ